jgi:hypothetical protein
MTLRLLKKCGSSREGVGSLLCFVGRMISRPCTSVISHALPTQICSGLRYTTNNHITPGSVPPFAGLDGLQEYLSFAFCTPCYVRFSRPTVSTAQFTRPTNNENPLSAMNGALSM